MPKIKEYNQQVAASGPVEIRHIDTTGGVGNAITELGDAGHKLGHALERREEQSEVSDLHAKISQAHADFTNQWHETINKADPADKDVGSKFLKQYDDYVSQLEEGITTRAGKDYFTQANAQLRAHFAETAFTGQAHLAGEKAVQDVKTAINNYSSSLVNDPSSFKISKKFNEDGIDAFVASGSLSREKALELKAASNTEFAKSAATGWAKLDPEFAKKLLDAGEWNAYLNGDQKRQMYGVVHEEIRGREVEANRRRVEEERVVKEQQEVTKNDFVEKLTKNELTVKMVLDSNLDAADKKQHLNMIEHASKNVLKTDPGTFVSLFDRIHLPDGDPRKITDEGELNAAFSKGGLSMEGLNQLRGEMQGKKTEAGQAEAALKKSFFDVAKNKITRTNPVTGIKDPIGDDLWMKFYSGAQQAYADGKKAGKNSFQMFTPNSPDYLGNVLPQFVRPSNQVVRDMVKTNTAPVPGSGLAAPALASPQSPATYGPQPTATPPPKTEARKPGESPADFLKRLGK